MPDNVFVSPSASSSRKSGTAEPATPRRRMTAADRRDAILAAAERAFGEGSFHQISLDDVAVEAGISKALIYEHFPSKRELYRALLTAGADLLLIGVSRAVAEGSGREGRLRGGIGAFLDFVSEHPGAFRMLFHNVADPDVVSELDRLREEAATVIANLMSDDVPASRGDDSIPADRAVAMLAYQLIGALQSLALWWDVHPEIPREQVERMAMEFSWLGLDRVAAGDRWGS